MKFLNHDISKIKFIDFHTHLHQAQYELPADTLKVFSIELEDFIKSPPVHRQNNFYSVGLHPWRLPESLNHLQTHIDKLRNIIDQPGVIALGEAGLDRIKGADINVQTAYLEKIIELSEQTDKPLIVHCVRCYPELISLKKRLAANTKMMVHGYNAKPEILEQLFEHKFYVSLGIKALKREDICLYIRNNPLTLSQLCLETDDSDITIQDVFALAARELGLDIEKVSRIMKNNFVSLFQEPENA
jgi:TatD DNase family protein